MRIVSAVLLSVFCLVNVPLLYGDTFGSVNITAEPVEQTGRREHGYVEFKFHLYNQSEREACRVTLVVQGRYSGREGRAGKCEGPRRWDLFGCQASLHKCASSIKDRITVIIDGKRWRNESRLSFKLHVDKSALSRRFPPISAKLNYQCFKNSLSRSATARLWR